MKTSQKNWNKVNEGPGASVPKETKGLLSRGDLIDSLDLDVGYYAL